MPNCDEEHYAIKSVKERLNLQFISCKFCAIIRLLSIPVEAEYRMQANLVCITFVWIINAEICET